MRYSRYLMIAVIAAVIVGFSGVVSGQDDAPNNALTIGDILSGAECPLTEDQANTLSTVKIGGDFSVFQKISTMFSDDQTAALMDAFGSSPGFNGGPEQPRMLFFAIIFENEECPFTAEQVGRIKKLSDEDPMAMFEEMQDIFTDEQDEVMQSMMQF